MSTTVRVMIFLQEEVVQKQGMTAASRHAIKGHFFRSIRFDLGPVIPAGKYNTRKRIL
jgi:hypothetical protein